MANVDAALEYLKRGWPVIPGHNPMENGLCSCLRLNCDKPGKHPRVQWREFETKLPAEHQVRGWWRRWPDASVIEARRKEAEALPLFATDAPLEFSLTADFKTVNKDRDVESTKVFPATMTVTNADGSKSTFTLNIRTRGHVRRMARTSGAVGGIAARVAGERVFGIKTDRAAHAEDLKAILGGLKGPLMKVAQFLSTVPDADRKSTRLNSSH